MPKAAPYEDAIAHFSQTMQSLGSTTIVILASAVAR